MEDEATVSLISKDKREEKQEEQHRSWCSLSPDLLSIISSYLYAGDYVNFHVVCKAWQPIATLPSQLLPALSLSDFVQSQSSLLMHGCIDDATWKFHHPIYNQICHMDIPEMVGAHIRCANYGWLLISRDDRSALFFNPFTKQNLQLPSIPRYQFDEMFWAMSFSSPPTSSNCIVVAVSSFDDGCGYIGILKRGENWRIHEVEGDSHFEMSSSSPVLYKGLYYCLGVDGSVGTFDPNDDECEWSVWNTGIRRKLRNMHAQSFLVKNDGGLAAVFVPTSKKHVCVLQWDDSKNRWRMVRSLGNKMFFVSRGASSSKKAAAEGMGNKIYVPMLHNKNGVFYSLTTWKYHSFYDNYSCDGPFGMEKAQAAVWVKPVLKRCKDNLKW